MRMLLVAPPTRNIEHQLHGAGARADHQVGAADGLRKTLAHVGAHALHESSNSVASAIDSTTSAERRTPVPGTVRRQVQRLHAMLSSRGVARLISAREICRSNWFASCLSWLTNTNVLRAALHSPSSSAMKASRSAVSSADVGSSAITTSGAPIKARAAATRCCCPTDKAPAGRVHVGPDRRAAAAFAPLSARCRPRLRRASDGLPRSGRAAGHCRARSDRATD